MPNEFTVVGEHKADNTLLLVLGTDGQYYVYFPETEAIIEIDPDEDWEIFHSRDDGQPEFSVVDQEES